MAETKPNLPPVRACIFDMDGLLIDSEDLYTEGTNITLKKYGRPNMPWSIKAQLQGRPNPVANEILCSWAKLPISPAEYKAEQAEIQAGLFPKCQPLPGVPELLRTLRDRAGVELALATSSQARNYELKSAHLPHVFDEYFGDDDDDDDGNQAAAARNGSGRAKGSRVLGDDPRIPAGRGKPRGDIFLLALRLINEARRARARGTHDDAAADDIRPDECLVFEDSVFGVEAGRRAGMRVVWCPHPELAREYVGREPAVLAGRTGETDVTEEADVAREMGLKGWPSAVGDGWATQVKTLEDFDYEKVGIALNSGAS